MRNIHLFTCALLKSADGGYIRGPDDNPGIEIRLTNVLPEQRTPDNRIRLGYDDFAASHRENGGASLHDSAFFVQVDQCEKGSRSV